MTPALWGLIPEDYGGSNEKQSGGYQPSYEQPQQQPYQDQRPPFDSQPSGQNWDEHKHQKVDIPSEEQNKHWWDLDDERKKKLEVRVASDRRTFWISDTIVIRSAVVLPSVLPCLVVVYSRTTTTRRARSR